MVWSYYNIINGDRNLKIINDENNRIATSNLNLYIYFKFNNIFK